MQTDPHLLVVVASTAFLPTGPSPVTLHISLDSGRILDIHHELRPRSHYPHLDSDRYIDCNSTWLLPAVSPSP